MGSLAETKYVRRGEEWQGTERHGGSEKGGVGEEMRPKDKGIIFVKVEINERLVHSKLINLTMKGFRDDVRTFRTSSH